MPETGEVFNSKFLFKFWGCLSTIDISPSGMLIVPIKSRSLFPVFFCCTLGVDVMTIRNYTGCLEKNAMEIQQAVVHHKTG
jgi:hypothetical protein